MVFRFAVHRCPLRMGRMNYCGNQPCGINSAQYYSAGQLFLKITKISNSRGNLIESNTEEEPCSVRELVSYSPFFAYHFAIFRIFSHITIRFLVPFCFSNGHNSHIHWSPLFCNNWCTNANCIRPLRSCGQCLSYKWKSGKK